MNFYETVFVCSPLLNEEEIDELIEKIKSLITKENGQVMNVNKWGRKKLAYPIKRHREGYYIFIEFQASGDLIKKLENLYQVTDKIIRYLTVKKEKTVTTETKT